MTDAVNELIAELQGLATQAASGDGTLPDLADLEPRVRAAAQAAPAEDRQRLFDALGAAEVSIVEAMERIGERLKDLGSYRGALAAYRSLRPHTAGRHVSSRA